MKASELVKVLQTLIEINGDQEVWYEHNDYYEEVSSVIYIGTEECAKLGSDELHHDFFLS